MTDVTPSLLPPHRFRLALVLAALAGCASASFAQSTPTAPPAPSVAADTVRLTDEQRMAILDSNTPDSAAAARGERVGSERAAPEIHGEAGMMIGTHGTRGAYGAAEIPLGDSARATVSVESSRSGYRR